MVIQQRNKDVKKQVTAERDYVVRSKLHNNKLPLTFPQYLSQTSTTEVQVTATSRVLSL